MSKIKSRHSRPSETRPPLKEIPDEGARRRRKKYFLTLHQLNPQMDLCTLDFRGCSRSFVSLMHTDACPSRCILTCPILQSGGAGLFRTQLQVYAVEKCVFWGVAQLDPQMNSCTLNFRGCSRSFVSLLHTVACPPRCPLTRPILTSGGAGLIRTQL